MNYVKKIVCAVIMLALLSPSNSFTIEWGPYFSGWQDTCNRAKNYAGSYVPDWSTWEKVKFYGPSFALTDPINMKYFSIVNDRGRISESNAAVSLPPIGPALLSRAQYLQRSAQKPEDRISKWDYLLRPLAVQIAGQTVGALRRGILREGMPSKYELKRFFSTYLPFVIAAPVIIPALIAALTEYYDDWKAQQATNPSQQEVLNPEYSFGE